MKIVPISKIAFRSESVGLAALFGCEDAIFSKKYMSIRCRKITLLARKALASPTGLFLRWGLFSNSGKGFQRSGQALLMTVVAIGAAMLATSVIAGLLMSYQIRGSTDIGNSQHAIAAADAGLECQMYDEFNGGTVSCSGIAFSNSAKVVNVTCTDSTDATVACSATSTVSNIYSSGNYKGAERTLEVSF